MTASHKQDPQPSRLQPWLRIRHALRQWRARWRDRPSLGRHGEDLAARHLQRHGYRILHRNALLGRYEVDLIAQDGDTIVFVEVKTRQTGGTFLPEDNIGPKKEQHLRRAAAMYQARRDDPSLYYRFDVVCIVAPPGGPPEITLYRNAF
jgi:putative endonuclease